MKWAILIVLLGVAVHLVIGAYKSYVWNYVRDNSAFYKAVRDLIGRTHAMIYRNQELSRTYMVELPFHDEAAYQACDYDAFWTQYIRNHVEFVAHIYERTSDNLRHMSRFNQAVAGLDDLRIKTILPFGHKAYCRQVEKKLTDALIEAFREDVIDDFEIQLQKSLYFANDTTNPILIELQGYTQKQVAAALDNIGA